MKAPNFYPLIVTLFKDMLKGMSVVILITILFSSCAPDQISIRDYPVVENIEKNTNADTTAYKYIVKLKTEVRSSAGHNVNNTDIPVYMYTDYRYFAGDTLVSRYELDFADLRTTITRQNIIMDSIKKENASLKFYNQMMQDLLNKQAQAPK